MWIGFKRLLNNAYSIVVSVMRNSHVLGLFLLPRPLPPLVSIVRSVSAITRWR